MSLVEHEVPYDGTALFCGDGAYAIPFVIYLKEKYGQDKTDLLTVPGGSRSISMYEEAEHTLSSRNAERLATMQKSTYIELATYLNHGGGEIHLCDHFGCGFWFGYKNYVQTRAAQIISMWMAVERINNFINRIKEDSQFAAEWEVNPNNIKVKKFVLHYATLDNKGNLIKIEQVGELSL